MDRLVGIYQETRSVDEKLKKIKVEEGLVSLELPRNLQGCIIHILYLGLRLRSFRHQESGLSVFCQLLLGSEEGGRTFPDVLWLSFLPGGGDKERETLLGPPLPELARSHPENSH